MNVMFVAVSFSHINAEVLLMFWQPDSIRIMGDKSTARETMKNAGVPTVPGSAGLLQVSHLTNVLRIMVLKI